MVMELRVKNLKISTFNETVILHRDTAKKINVHAGDRIKLRKNRREYTYVVEIDEEGYLVKKNEVGIPQKFSHFNDKDTVMIRNSHPPLSKSIIKKKIAGLELSHHDIKIFVDDVYHKRLSKMEIASYLTAVKIHGMTLKEIYYLTKEMYKYGEIISWPWHWKVMDKHSIGGIPGNRTTPIVVSIIAASGLKIPKTSSRSITSPAGTADTIEVLADVSFSAEEIKKIVKKTNGCLVWGGALDLAPVDDILIQVEKPLNLDPEGQVIASILSKKKSVGSRYVLIDIPYGDEAKIEEFNRAKMLADKFKIVGAYLGMEVESIITKGSAPIGRGVGPVLEMIDVLNTLYGKGSPDLKEKSLEMAGIMLQMAGKGDYTTAKAILESGKALHKFKEIIEEQNGSINKPLVQMLGKYTYEVKASHKGVVEKISNHAIAEIAKRAGAPSFKGAGVWINKKLGDHVKKGDTLFTIYAESERKLDYALEVLKENPPYLLSRKNKFILLKVD